MAIYHFSAKMISRAAGSSALASAAYRSASRLHDQRLDRHHDFSNKAGVVHSEVLLPEGAPDHLSDRERLWNEVEAVEVRKDAQRTIQAYQDGRMDDYRSTRRSMGEMAEGLRRDPQLESVLAIRKQELGITMDMGRSIGAQLAMERGINLGLGRGLGR